MFLLKTTTVWGKVVHKNFHVVINHLKKDPNHNSLKVGRFIAQIEGKYPICKGTPTTGESSIVLVLGSNLDLIVTIESIQKGKQLLPRQGIKFLIDKM